MWINNKIGNARPDSEMNPTRPRTQAFATGIIKAVTGDG